MINSFIAINKNSGITSNKVVVNLRKVIGDKTIKVGHTGTLDPLAQGVLIVGVGEATKFSDYILNQDKSYHVEASFGSETDTNDSDGSIIDTKLNSSLMNLSNEEFVSLLQETIDTNLVGEIEQAPPRYSAIKVAGRKLYEYARQNKEVDIPKRTVKIYSFRVQKNSTPTKPSFIIKCSKGTYIRSLIRDLGYLLKTYAHVTYLNRTKVGKVSLLNTVTIDEILNQQNLSHALFNIEELMPQTIEKLVVNENIATRLIQGQRIFIGDINSLNQSKEVKELQLFRNNIFIGICKLDGVLLRPKRMMKKISV